MRVILAGKHELACTVFDFLRSLDLEVGVITCRAEEESLSGRKIFKKLLSQHDLSPLNGDDYSHDRLFKVIDSFRPDILISTGFDKIIKKEVINRVKWPVNIHPSKLPKYRGSYSVPWAIINNDPTLGSTLHLIDSGIDSGGIISQSEIPNLGDKSSLALYTEVVDEGAKLFASFLTSILNEDFIKVTPQNEEDATYYDPTPPQKIPLEWRQTANYIYNLIRACHFPPYPSATSYIKNMSVGIGFPVRKVLMDETQRSALSSVCGTIVRWQSVYGITAFNGLIIPEMILLNGSINLDFQDFVREYSLESDTFVRVRE